MFTVTSYTMTCKEHASLHSYVNIQKYIAQQ